MLAYLPQHLTELGATAFFVCVFVSSLPALITGRSATAAAQAPRRIRLLVLLGLVLAAMIVFASFVIDAQPLGGLPGGHWGTHEDKVVLGVWLALLAAIAAFNLVRELRYIRGRR